METRAPRVWRGQTHDDRSQARRVQLMNAGFELMGDEGMAGLTMRAVCRNAGLSLRYFYENFASTDELAVAIYDQCNAELVQAIAAIAGKPSPVSAAVNAAAGYFEADPRRLRILLREPQSSDLLAGRRTDVLPSLLGQLTGSAGSAESPEAAGLRAMSASALSGALITLLLDWSDGRLPVSRAELVDFATGMVLAGLSSGRPRR